MVIDMKMRRTVFFILWILSLVLISFYGGTVSYGIFSALTLIPFISLIYIACVSLRYKVYQEIGSRNIVCGQSTPYYFVLQNEDKFAFAGIGISFFSDFSYVEELPEKTEYELLPGDKYKYETSFVCRYRGEYEVGIKEVTIYDFFGLFCLRRKVKETKKVIVAPRLIKIHELNSIADIDAMMHKENTKIASQLDIVTREYTKGDAINQIHWKATAREQKLMSRRMTGEEKEGVILFFDMYRYDENPKIYLPMENRLLETVLALAFFVSEKNTPLVIYYSQGRMRQDRINGMGDLGEFYELTKGLKFDKTEDMQSGIRHILSRVPLIDKQIVFFVLQHIDYEILDMTKRISESGVIVVFYVITEENMESLRMMSNTNRKIIIVTPQDRLEDIL